MEECGISYTYREYRKEPLSVKEIRSVLRALEVGAKDLLRKNDLAFKALGLTGQEDDDSLIEYMAANPTLLQRPIGRYEDRAVVGRPPENLLTLVEEGL